MALVSGPVRRSLFKCDGRGVGVLANRQARSVAHAEYVRVNGDSVLAEGELKHDVRALATNARQPQQFLACVRNLAGKIVEQHTTEFVDTRRLSIVKPARTNGLGNCGLGELQHCSWRLGQLEQGRRGCGCVAIERLCRKNARNACAEGVGLSFGAFRIAMATWHDLRQNGVHLVDLGSS